jgi:hypothetical protein
VLSMQKMLGATAAVLFMLTTLVGAQACSASHSKSAGTSAPIDAAGILIATPKPKTGG